jgi:hypothetical protein
MATPMPVEEYASVRALKENKPCYGVFMGVVRGKDDIAWIIVNAAPIPNLGVAISYQEFTDLKEPRKRTANSRNAPKIHY